MSSAQQVVVTATLRVKEGLEERFVEEFSKVITATHGEPGCRRYALHRDQNDPQTFVIVERWDDQASLDAHFRQPHMEPLAGLAGELLSAPPALNFTTPVPVGDPEKGVL